jgi:hypothetical protein
LNLTRINQNIKKIHFLILGFVFLNFTIQLTTNYGLNTKLIFILKCIIYLSGFTLFFLNRKPIKKITFYYSYYLFSLIILLLFRIFGGIFLGLLSSLILFPIYPKEVKYEKDNLKVYEKFTGFLGACCQYEIVENKLLIFEKKYGFIKLEGQIEAEKSEIKLFNNIVEYKHKVRNYNYEYQKEIETDTLEKIEVNQ